MFRVHIELVSEGGFLWIRTVRQIGFYDVVAHIFPSWGCLQQGRAIVVYGCVPPAFVVIFWFLLSLQAGRSSTDLSTVTGRCLSYTCIHPMGVALLIHGAAMMP